MRSETPKTTPLALEADPPHTHDSTRESDTLRPWSWSATPDGETHLLFLGRSPGKPPSDLETGLASCAQIPSHLSTARLQQIHSAQVLTARPGPCGEGDALVTLRRGLALAVVTADCVPVVLAARDWLAAVHAGWRGLVAGVLRAALDHPTFVGQGIPTVEVRAWIGPAIGPCCYEVGEDVARRVIDASHETVAHQGPRGKSHLDLVAAAVRQLEAAGIRDIETVDLCTRCHPDKLWSYRRDGPAAGRNITVVWRDGPK